MAEKKRRGNPGKYDPALIPIVVKLVERGFIDIEIAETLGIAETTLYNWKREHEEFAAAMKRPKEVLCDQVEESLLLRANGFTRKVEKAVPGQKQPIIVEEYFPPDVSAQKFYLQHRRPEVFREQREITSKIDVSEWLRKSLEKMSEEAKLERSERAKLVSTKLIDHEPT